MAVIIATGANGDGRREVLGIHIGPSEAEPFWTASLMIRGAPSHPGKPSCPYDG